VYIPVKIATDYDTNLPPEKLKAATQNEQNDGWLIVKNRPQGDIGARFPNSSFPMESRQWILANKLAVMGNHRLSA
jgi:hypothetical protein